MMRPNSISLLPCRQRGGLPSPFVLALFFDLVVIGCMIPRATAAPQETQAAFKGRVVDETGKPAPQARVWLYLKASRWEHADLLIRKITTGADGTFAFGKPPNLRRSDATEDFGYVIVADHPKYAVGWRNIAVNKQHFEGDIILTPPVTRSLTVTDEQGKPMPGAVVNACLLGDAHSPGSRFPDVLTLRVDEGPLAAVTDGQGRAALDHLPMTEAAFSATASGYARGYTATYSPRSPGVIRMTPSASLSGTVRDETGRPIAGVTAVIVAEPTRAYVERTKTDAVGQYRFEGLRAHGWTEWPGAGEFQGNYTIRIESPHYAARPVSVLMEPGDQRNSFDVAVVPASRLNVGVVAKETGQPLAGILITGSSPAGNFAANTKGDGMASFSIIPGRFRVSISEVPEGQYVDGSLRSYPETSVEGIADGSEAKVKLTMPPIRGRLIAVSGSCRLPGGKNAPNAVVYPSAGNFDYQGHHTNFVLRAKADSSGRFLLKAVPSGRRVALYAESEDGQFAGTTSVETRAEDNPASGPVITLQPTVKVSRILKNADGVPLASKSVEINAVVGDRTVDLYRRAEKSDAQGRIELSRIIPGLKYHLIEVIDLEPRRGVPLATGKKYDENIVLAPQ
jgi:hypothetical protein